ncbi:ABC transporter permease subunit [Metabacillus litoralis]|uniref:ABC transporter permease subunit n=1 Tax=Metabacillus litoralis TaxID=152268 RepID=UPI0020416A58|nr:ABC transporter permease subunit [Metabacillus litoralis]MCM3410923.1 ABC transporter permease [Metabacillus litoralis]
MVAPDLLKHEIKKHWVQLFIMVLFISFLLPAQIWLEYLNVINIKDLPEDLKEIDLQHFGSAFLLCVFVITLAIVQIGVERSNGNMEFNLSLPFSRGSIYLTKWSVGAVSIVLSWVIAFTITAILILFIDIPVLYFTEFYLYLLGALLLLYSVTFAAGAFTGNPLAQGLVALTVSVFPILVFGLTLIQIGILFYPEVNIDHSFESAVYNLSPISYLFFTYGHYPVKSLFLPFIISLLFFSIGYYAFQKHPFERNGSFFVWRWMERPAQVIVIILGILGFSTLGYISSSQEDMVGYIIGAAIGAGIGFIISYFAIYKKQK